jgi:hypothetical protein
LRSRQLRSYSRISRHFMEPGGLLPCSKKPFTGPYPELDQYDPYHLILSLRSSLMLSSHLRLVLSSSLYPSGFPTNILYAFLLSNACYMPYRSHPFRLDHSNYTWRSVQVMKLLIMQFFSNRLSLQPFSVQIFSSNTLSLCSSLKVRDQVSHPYI